MTFILVPSVALKRRAKNAGVALAPDAPLNVSRVRKSSSEKTGTVFPTSTIAVSTLGVPSQLNCRGSNRASGVPNSRSHGGVFVHGPHVARHVAHDDGGRAGDRRPDVGGNRGGQSVVAAGRTGGDDQRHRAAAV